MAGLVVLMWNIKCIIFCSMIVPCLNAFALSGRVNIICCGITQGVASLALGYVLHWAFIDIIGCGSAIQASLIAFALHDDSARPC